MNENESNVRKPGYYWVKVYNSDDFTIARYVHNDIWIHEGRAHSEKYFDEIDLEPITRNEPAMEKEHCQKHKDGYETCQDKCYYHGGALKTCEQTRNEAITSELLNGLKVYVHHMERFFGEPKVGQPPSLQSLRDLITKAEQLKPE